MNLKKMAAAAAVLFILGASVWAGGSKQTIRLATGGTTGTYYAFGSAVGQIFQAKTGIPFTVQSTGASKANILMIQDGEVEMAIVQNDVMDYAYKGTELFNGAAVKDFSAMAAVYAEACQIVADPKKVKSIADLKGLNVSVGDVGSGTEFNARQILEAYGITFDDIKKQNLGFGPSADALRDGKIDAFFCVAGAPTTAIIDLAVGRDITILEVDDAHASALKQKYPFYSQLTIPGGSYKGVPNAVKTVTIKATFIVSNKLSADTVYKLTKTLIEDKEEIQAAHAKGAEISAAYAVDGISVPYHPGAEKYFKEIGALK